MCDIVWRLVIKFCSQVIRGSGCFLSETWAFCFAQELGLNQNTFSVIVACKKEESFAYRWTKNDVGIW